MALPFSIPQIIMVVAVVFCIIELGLTCYVASVFNDGRRSWSPSSVNFGIFNSIWSLLVLAYLALSPVLMPKIYHRFIALGLLAVTTIFWFSGAIAIAAWIGGFDCRGGACSATQAASAFGFFIWIAFTALLTLEILDFMRGRGKGTDTGAVQMDVPKPVDPAGPAQNQPYPNV